MADHAITIKELKKSFRSHFLIHTTHILKGVNLYAETGEIYGFLGSNGAGKTTTIKCILGLIFPQSGEILLQGKPSASLETRKILGFLPENPYFYDYLTAHEVLNLTGRLFNMPKKLIKERTQHLLKLVGLQGKEDIRLRKFSKGMTQRAGLAQALFNDPQIIILDEPFSGLDPIGRKELRDIILGLKEQGKTVFFSSHILQDMELICDRVGILRDGIIARQGRLSELVSDTVSYYEIVCNNLNQSMAAALGKPYHFRDQECLIQVTQEEELTPIIQAILATGGRIQAIQPIKKTLEDIYLQEVGRA